jgi:hypothetical protein
LPFHQAGARARALVSCLGSSRLRPYLWLFLLSFPLWYAGLVLRGGKGLLDHSPIDQHTRQARAWLAGRIDLPGAPDYLEIADHDGRLYVSFPPVPSLVELPLVLLFGERTPNALFGIYLFWLLALVAQLAVLRRRGWDEPSALRLSLAFVFGTNLYVTCVRANVWAYGQSLGFCLAVIGLVFVVENRAGRSAPGYLLLALAVGCRPLLALLFPLYLTLDHRTCGRSLGAAVRSALLGAAPVGLALAAYNFARFGSVLEFGHNHLDWARALPEGIFSLSYLPWNAYHALLRLPEGNAQWPYLRFDTAGTAFWLNNAPLALAIVGLVTRRFDPWVRATCAFALLTIGLGVLCYEGKGNTQFGFRYVIDLLPAGFVAFAFAYSRLTRGMLVAAAFSALLNLYGLAVWKELPRTRPASVTHTRSSGISERPRSLRALGIPFLTAQRRLGPDEGVGLGLPVEALHGLEAHEPGHEGRLLRLVGAGDGGVVAADGHGHARLEEGQDGVGLPRLHRSRVVVRRDADLHHDAVAGQPPEQLGVGGGRAAVPDPVGPQLVHRLPHVFGGSVLPGVDGGAQPSQARHLEGALEEAGRVAALGARDVEAHDPRALVQVLGLGQGLAGQDLGDVGPVLAHRDHDEAQLQVVALLGMVHPGEHGADRLARREAGEGVDHGRVAKLQGGDPGPDRLLHDGLGDPRDVLVELGDPEGVVHLVEVGQESPLLLRLQLEAAPHLGLALHGVEPLGLHELPGDGGGDGAVHVLVELDLPELLEVPFDFHGGL